MEYIHVLYLLIAVSVVCGAAVLWFQHEYDRKFDVCMAQKLWQPECDHIHTFNPEFDCLNQKIDASRSNTTWAVYYCAATVGTRDDI